jgi:hypothetical protein
LKLFELAERNVPSRFIAITRYVVSSRFMDEDIDLVLGRSGEKSCKGGLDGTIVF